LFSVRVFISAALLLSAACTTQPYTLEYKLKYTPQHISQRLAGQWNNTAQYAAAPAALKVPPSVEGLWLDQQHASFTQVLAPLLGEHVLYLEWRNSKPDGTAGSISRQRLWVFKTDSAGAVRMDFYAFVDGAPFVGQADNAQLFRSLTPQSLRGYGAACALTFVQQGSTFSGSVDASVCSITAASGRRMGISARVELLDDGSLAYQESGQLADGRFAFRVPPEQAYRFRRVQ
jgi:hypothetical protein